MTCSCKQKFMDVVRDAGGAGEWSEVRPSTYIHHRGLSFSIRPQLINSYSEDILLLKRKCVHSSKNGLAVASQTFLLTQPLPNVVSLS